MSKKTDRWREKLAAENETFWLSKWQFKGLPEKFQELCAGTPFEGSRIVLTGEYTKRTWISSQYRWEAARYQVAVIPSVASYKKIPGHRFVGYCQSEGAGWIVHCLDQDFEFTPKIVAELEPHRCDVCGHRRERKRLFCLVEEESGELVVVGGSCAKKFRGINLERLLSKLLFPITKLICELGERLAWGRPPIEELIAKAEIIIGAWGYVSASESEIHGTVRTAYWLSVSESSKHLSKYQEEERAKVWELYTENRDAILARTKELEASGCGELIEYFDNQAWSVFNSNCLAYIRARSEKASWGFIAFFGSIKDRVAEKLKRVKHRADHPVIEFDSVPLGKVSDFGEFRVAKTQWRSNQFGDSLCFTCVNEKNEKVWFKIGESSAAYKVFYPVAGDDVVIPADQSVYVTVRAKLTDVKDGISFAKNVKFKKVEVR